MKSVNIVALPLSHHHLENVFYLVSESFMMVVLHLCE